MFDGNLTPAVCRRRENVRLERQPRIIIQPDCPDELRACVHAQARLFAKTLERRGIAHRGPFGGPGTPEPLLRLGPDRRSRRIKLAQQHVYRVHSRYLDVLHGRH